MKFWIPNSVFWYEYVHKWYLKTWIYFRNEDPKFGALTLLFVICPVIAYIVLDLIYFKKNGRFQDKDIGKYGFLWQLPLIKLRKYWSFLERLANNILNEDSEDQKRFDSDVSMTKMIEIFFESGPQFILQLSILLRSSSGSSITTFSNYVTTNPGSATIKILTLSTSFASLLIGASDIFQILPQVKVFQKSPRHGFLKSLPSFLVIYPCLLMTISPKLLTLSLFFGSCQPLPGMICLLIFVVVYSITFFLLTYPIYRKYKTEENAGQYQINLVKAFLSSVISPCIVIHPKTKTIWLSSIASSCAHIILLLFLIVFPTYLNIPFERTNFEIICYTLLGLQIVSPIFTWVLNRYNREASFLSAENVVSLSLVTINGHNVENEAFVGGDVHNLCEMSLSKLS